MNYEETLSYIHSLGMFSLPAGLDRIKKVLSLLLSPQDKFKSIHIAGTNGKGSVSVMTASVLMKAGFKTGLFVSPYITDFRERITVNGEFIEKEALCRLSQKVIETGIKLTEFEFITAVGFLYFAQIGCDIAVIEVGLGGRLDATNALNQKNVSVITKIGLDHTVLLGDTLGKIASEKCGIISNETTVSYPLQDTEALEVIKEKSNKLIIPDIKRLEIINSSVLGNRFVYKDEEYEISLGGKHQIMNALTAIEVLENCGLNIEKNDLKAGLSSAFIPARLEVISKEPPVLLDGAHNPDGAYVLKEEMRKYKGKIIAVIGMMRDKDFSCVIENTVPFCKTVIAVKAADNKRAATAKEIAKEALKYCSDVICADSYEQAVKKAKEIRGENPVFVFGSLYLASSVRNILKNTFK